MKLLLAAFSALTLLSTAPFQCASDPDPEYRVEDTPAEALWNLSEHFRGEGNELARRQTLEHLVERYPSSRESHRAQMVLDGEAVDGEAVDDHAVDGEAAHDQSSASAVAAVDASVDP